MIGKNDVENVSWEFRGRGQVEDRYLEVIVVQKVFVVKTWDEIIWRKSVCGDEQRFQYDFRSILICRGC